MTAPDALALGMLAALLLSLAPVAGIIFFLVRNAGRKEEEIFSEDSPMEEREKAPAGEREAREPWEREADWWRKSE